MDDISLANRDKRTNAQRLDDIETLLRLLLLTAGSNMPVTQVAGALAGGLIGTTSQYIELYRNNYRRLVAVRVAADFNLAGQTVALSITTDQTNYGQVDFLTNGVKDKSDVIWLRPDQTLYINTLNTGVTLTGARFRILAFDALAFTGVFSSGV
jgi:hypothetical protein